MGAISVTKQAGWRGRADYSVEFSLLMQAWKLGPALATGCTVIDAGGADAIDGFARGRIDAGGGIPGWRGEFAAGWADGGSAIARHMDG